MCVCLCERDVFFSSIHSFVDQVAGIKVIPDTDTAYIYYTCLRKREREGEKGKEGGREREKGRERNGRREGEKWKERGREREGEREGGRERKGERGRREREREKEGDKKTKSHKKTRTENRHTVISPATFMSATSISFMHTLMLNRLRAVQTQREKEESAQCQQWSLCVAIKQCCHRVLTYPLPTAASYTAGQYDLLPVPSYLYHCMYNTIP